MPNTLRIKCIKFRMEYFRKLYIIILNLAIIARFNVEFSSLLICVCYSMTVLVLELAEFYNVLAELMV